MTLRLFIRLVVYLLLASSPFFLFLPIGLFPSFYDVRYMGLAGLVAAIFIILIPKFFQVPVSTPDFAKKNHAVELLQFLLAFLFFTNILGDLGLYQLYRFGIQFDKILHFVNPLVVAVVGVIFLHNRFGLASTPALVSSFIFVVLFSAGWEMIEYTLDRLLNSRLYGVNGVNINYDTQFDLLYDTIGAAVGVLIMAVKRKTKSVTPISIEPVS